MRCTAGRWYSCLGQLVNCVVTAMTWLLIGYNRLNVVLGNINDGAATLRKTSRILAR